jgi:hypothetical protein
MKTMKQFFIAIALLVFGMRCNNPKLPQLPAGFDYTITEDKLDKGLDRRIIRVKINQELSESGIKNLSDWIKDNRTDATNMIIFYYRTDEVFSGAWVRVDYNPEYKYDLMATPML